MSNKNSGLPQEGLLVSQKDMAKATKAMQNVGIPFFYKQWRGFNKKKAGRLFDDRTWDDMPALHHRTKTEDHWTALREAPGD